MKKHLINAVYLVCAFFCTAAESPSGNYSRISHPWHMKCDENGNLYVVEWKERIVCKYDPEGRLDTAFGENGIIGNKDTDNDGIVHGCGDGEFSGELPFHGPGGIALDGQGNIFVADTVNSRIEKFKPDGALDLSFGNNGIAGINEDREVDRILDSGRKNREFKYPLGICCRGELLYIADTLNNRWQILSCKDGRFIDSGTASTVVMPNDIVADSKGYIYLICGDFYKKQCWITKIDPNTKKPVPGYGVNGRLGLGFSRDAGFFDSAKAMAMDDDDNLYIADSNNGRIQVFDCRGFLLNAFYPPTRPVKTGALSIDRQKKNLLVIEYYENKTDWELKGILKRYSLHDVIDKTNKTGVSVSTDLQH